jgi:hypothetical protein
MDYILTTKPVSYSGFSVVKSVSDIGRLTMKSTLIVESYTDKDFDFAIFLLNAVRDCSLTKIAYIADKPVRILLELMRTIGAFVMSDSSLIESTESFSELLEFLATNKVSTKAEELEVLADSFVIIDQYIQGKFEQEPKVEKRRLSLAYKEVSDALQEVVFSEELSKELQSFLLSASSKVKVYEDELSQREKELDNIKSSSFGSFGSISAYTQYTYTGNSRVLVIKEKAPTRYLTSFLISYVDWLSRVPELNAKLIVVENDSDFVDLRYKNLAKADAKTILQNRSSLFLVPAIYTTTPTQTVMQELMYPTMDLYVVLDRTYKRNQAITGRGINTVFATSSRRLMRDFDLTSEECIVNELGEQTQLGVLAPIESYAVASGSRIMQQQKAFDSIMRKLTERCGFSL